MQYSPLFTDLYQLTMAFGYWKLNMHNQKAAFHLIFRRNPFKGNYTIHCGLDTVLQFLDHWKFQTDDLEYLSSLKNTYGEPLFSHEFLHYLEHLTFNCDIFAIPEGTIVFPHMPLVRVEGPLLQCQLIETALLNTINFQSLIATKASRVCKAACGDPVIEFGMRRAQGSDGAISASRAAYIGGCVATSNTLAGKLFDIPVRGTHAHSWVSAFDSEAKAFEAYANIMPHNCVLLVDTYNTIQGVKNAIKVGKKLKQAGADLLGIRLDSGEMAALSIEARRLLDTAGFHNTEILASNSLDEYEIASLKNKNAKISSWGVGTHLTTAYDQPALDGVYKLSALRNTEDQWQYKLKISEQAIKISNPGRLQVKRFTNENSKIIDLIYDIDLGIEQFPQYIFFDESQHLQIDSKESTDLLMPVLTNGKKKTANFNIHETREKTINNLRIFYDNLKQNKTHGVALEKKLFQLKQKLITSLQKKE